MRWEAAFIQSDILQGIGIKNREEAEHVVDVVYRHTIKQEQVLVGTATAHVHTR